MPVFVIGLLANFVFNPILVRLARAWNEGNRKTFNKIVQRQIGVIIAITLLAVAVALTIGCPVLGLMFNADLTGSRWSLTILMIGGGMLALANFLIVIVTVIRKQKYLIPGYLAAAAAAKLLSEYFVTNYGIPGASVLYACLMTLASIFFAAVLIISIRKADTAQEN
jgi:O-antigen/teichoic acid export membrane protein